VDDGGKVQYLMKEFDETVFVKPAMFLWAVHRFVVHRQVPFLLEFSSPLLSDARISRCIDNIVGR
jgi:hypothetical protein